MNPNSSRHMMTFSVSTGVRLHEALLDVDGVLAPVVGYYRTFLVSARTLAAAVVLVEREIVDGLVLDCEVIAARREQLSRSVAALVPASPRTARVLWRSGRGFFRQSAPVRVSKPKASKKGKRGSARRSSR